MTAQGREMGPLQVKTTGLEEGLEAKMLEMFVSIQAAEASQRARRPCVCVCWGGGAHAHACAL